MITRLGVQKSLPIWRTELKVHPKTTHAGAQCIATAQPLRACNSCSTGVGGGGTLGAGRKDGAQEEPASLEEEDPRASRTAPGKQAGARAHVFPYRAEAQPTATNKSEKAAELKTESRTTLPKLHKKKSEAHESMA